ncbi:MAG: DUF4858 domain-containing protein [Tannerella sp.]|jgi:hypothetical protein|nr:DUF4858 domain-containing protein [Tannerella sp.]
MKKRVLITALFLTAFAWAGRTQEGWTAQDSTWLRRVLSGKEKLQLNEETLKAIRAGTLLSPGFPTRDSLLAIDRELPIISAFGDIASPQTRDTFPSHLPPGVYFLYGLRGNPSLPSSAPSPYVSERDIAAARSNLRFSAQNVEELKRLEKLTPRKATVNDPATLRYGSFSFSGDDLLQTLFRASHRAKKRNAKRAGASKIYRQY